MNTSKVCTLLLTWLLAACSCKKQEPDVGIRTDAQGVITALPALWKSSVSKDGTLAYGVRTSIVYDNGVLCAGGEKGTKPLGNQSLMMKDADTGKDRWQWNDKLTDFEALDIKNPYQYDKYLVFQQGPRGYCVDLSTGATVFKNQVGSDRGSEVSGLGSAYFLAGKTPASQEASYFGEYWIWRGSALRVSESPVVRPPYTRRIIKQFPAGKYVGEASVPYAFVQNADTLLAFGHLELSSPDLDKDNNDQFNYFLNLYNLSTKTWVYVSQPISGVSRVPYVTGDRILFSPGRSIVCHRLSTGEELWKNNTFGQDFSFSGLVITEGKVIGNNEDTYLYALDLETGRTIWREKSNGTPSRLTYLDGVVYYAAGQVLHAVEVATGKHLWKLQSPDVALNRGAYFYLMVAVVPGKAGQKGKVIANTGLNLYCYEAAK